MPYFIRDGKVARLEVQNVEGGGIPSILAQVGAMEAKPEKTRTNPK